MNEHLLSMHDVTAEDVVTQGVTKIEDLVNQLPQAFAAQNATVSNAATGTATVNLRGLGTTESGRALMPALAARIAGAMELSRRACARAGPLE